MKRPALAAIAALIALATAPHVAAAQTKYIWIGGSAAIPIGDTGDALETGYMGDVGFGIPMREKLDLHLGVLFGNNSHKIGDRSTDLLAGSIGVGYSLTTERPINPYLLGSVGMMRADAAGEAETDFMFQGGGGFSGRLSPRLGYWIEGRYLQSGSGDSKITLFPIAAGITIGIGS